MGDVPLASGCLFLSTLLSWHLWQVTVLTLKGCATNCKPGAGVVVSARRAVDWIVDFYPEAA